MVMERPQARNWRKSTPAAAGSSIAATHSAPIVERGETSTSALPTLMLNETARGSAPGRRATSAGTAGRNAGRTTPEVLLHVEMTPVTKATTPLTVPGVLKRAMSAL